jgi:serine/threonine protein kinase
MTEEIKLGKYQIIKELGRGGFGIVYEAKDIVLERHVALKVLHGQLTVDPHFMERFEQEAKLAAQLEHPNLVPVYDFGQARGYNYIVMGLMNGGSLKDHLEKHGTLDSSRAINVLEDMLKGLIVVHDNKIVHRDLKPANILFDQYGVARLSDLGFAKAMHTELSQSSQGGMVGTAAYMAPEIWRGSESSPLSDIYSLGCIIYEMLTGVVLFDGNTSAESMTKHLIDGPVFIVGVSSSWLKLIEKCLAKDPAERYQTARAILEDLKFGLFNTQQERQSEINLKNVDNELIEGVEKPKLVQNIARMAGSEKKARSVRSLYGICDNYYYGDNDEESVHSSDAKQTKMSGSEGSRIKDRKEVRYIARNSENQGFYVPEEESRPVRSSYGRFDDYYYREYDE